MSQPHDTTLHVRRAKSGDSESLAWLFERFTPLLLAQARFRLGRLSALVAAEDVVQDVWAVALPALPGLQPRAGRETPVVLKFLSTTLLYRVNELTRRHLRRGTRALESDDSNSREGGLSELPAPTRGVLSRVAARDTYRHVLEAIEGLPEEDRRVLVLRGIEQHSNERVAELLERSPNAVSLRYNRALRALREKLGDADGALDAVPHE